MTKSKRSDAIISFKLVKAMMVPAGGWNVHHVVENMVENMYFYLEERLKNEIFDSLMVEVLENVDVQSRGN